jgi:DNA-binding response OmpR family regulator
MKILVIDDEHDILDTVSVRLTAGGYSVITADTGEGGFAKAVSEKPDLILLDVMLPDIDGGMVAAKLRDNAVTRKIPVVFLTCIVSGKEMEGKDKIGGNFFIAKPFKSEELLAKIEDVLGG